MSLLAVFLWVATFTRVCDGNLMDWFAPEYKYGVVIDLGTGGSRVHVFCWPATSTTPYTDVTYAPADDQKNPWYMKINPGVTTYAHTPSLAGPSLKPLLDFAASKIPASVRPSTGLFIKGTEGLRATGDVTTALILESIYLFASRNYTFSIQPNHVALISGIEEGVFAWISVNKLSGYLDKTDIYASTGVLDMGQGSTQITFVPDTNVAIPNSYNYTFIYKRNTYKLYSKSFAGYGYTSALYSINATIARSVPTQQVQNPCFLTGFSQNFLGVNGDTKIVRGSGDWALCSNYTQAFVNKAVPCSYDRCSFNGQFQPKLRGDFFALSNFRDVTKIIGLKTKSTIQQIIDEGEKFCSISWADAVKDYPDADRLELAGFCFGANYVSVLLHYGYGMHSSFSITTDKNVGSLPASWAYGLMIHELQIGHA